MRMYVCISCMLHVHAGSDVVLYINVRNSTLGTNYQAMTLQSILHKENILTCFKQCCT